MAINLDELRRKHEELSGTKTKTNQSFLDSFLRLEEGTNLIRILPTNDEEKQFYAETKIHRVESNDGTIKNFHCRKVHNEECPLCDTYYALWNKSNAQDDEFANKARQIKPRERYYMNVVARSDSDEQPVKILSVGQMIFKKVIGTILDEDFGDITDLQNGHDYKIVKVMEGQWPKYDQSQPRPKPEAAGSDKSIAVWMDSLHDVHGLVKLEEYSDVKEAAEMVLPLTDNRPVESSSGGEESNDYLKKLES